MYELFLMYNIYIYTYILNRFPQDPLAVVLENVFAFDAYDAQMREVLYDVFLRHGIPLGELRHGRRREGE